MKFLILVFIAQSLGQFQPKAQVHQYLYVLPSQFAFFYGYLFFL